MNFYPLLGLQMRGHGKSPLLGILGVAISSALLTGCSVSPTWLSSSGPNASQVEAQSNVAGVEIPVFDVTDAVARRALAAEKRVHFA